MYSTLDSPIIFLKSGVVRAARSILGVKLRVVVTGVVFVGVVFTRGVEGNVRVTLVSPVSKPPGAILISFLLPSSSSSSPIIIRSTIVKGRSSSIVASSELPI